MFSPAIVAVASSAVPVNDTSQIGEVRRTVAAACQAVGLDETAGGRAAIVATEGATNLLKHAGGGEVVVSPLRDGPAAGVDLLLLDRGPGIPDLPLALADGHSTAGTRGNGLGAMRRQSSRFEVYTHPGQGTAIWSRVWDAPPPPAALEMAGLCVAMPGESECGDVWGASLRDGRARIVVADGLGHGPLAREAARVAVEAAHAHDGSAGRALEDAHAAARSTRGAAVAVAEVDLEKGEARFAGFGNVAAALLGPERSQSLVSMNGTAGQGQIKTREFSYRFDPGTLLVMSSDGLGSHWSLDPYPGLRLRPPALVAGVLYRDHSRRRDDTTVLAVRLGEMP